MLDLTQFPMALFEQSTSRAADLLRLLGNQHRLMILCQITDGELSVGELQRRLPLSQSALSQHLAKLRADGIVSTRREAQSIFYRIADPAALRIITTLAELFCPPQPDQGENI